VACSSVANYWLRYYAHPWPSQGYTRCNSAYAIDKPLMIWEAPRARPRRSRSPLLEYAGSGHYSRHSYGTVLVYFSALGILFLWCIFYHDVTRNPNIRVESAYQEAIQFHGGRVSLITTPPVGKNLSRP
jgi:hypothetical protein